MKKNLISVLILALCFANLVLTALLIFTIIPETKKANNLIDQVCQAISLDLNSGAATSGSQLPQDQIVDYALTAWFVAYHFHSTKRVMDIRPTARICPPRKMLS